MTSNFSNFFSFSSADTGDICFRFDRLRLRARDSGTNGDSIWKNGPNDACNDGSSLPFLERRCRFSLFILRADAY